MNEEELIFLISVTVVMPILALWIITSYQKTRLKYKRTRADDTLTTTELNGLIEDSVTSATAPLVERIEALERQMAPGRGGKLELDLEEDLGESESEAPSKTVGRTKA